MALPGVSNSVLDGGLGVTTPASSRACVFGVASSGPLNTPTLISNQRQLKDTFGLHGPLIDAVGYILDHAGGPVVVVRTSSDTAATYDDASTSELASSSGAGVDNEINLAIADGAPKNDYELLFTITTGGTVGQTKFTYSLDGGNSASPITAAGATVAIGDSGVIAHFETGTTAPYVAGATYASVAKCARPSAANLGTAFDALEANPGSLLPFDFLVMAGHGGTANEQNTLASTLTTRLAALFSTYDRPYRLIMSDGDDSAADALAEWAGYVDSRIAHVFGGFRAAPVFSMPGRALPLMPAAHFAAMRAAGNVISTDLAQTSGAASVGAIPGCVAISHDEFTENAGLNDAKHGTLRTYPNLIGFFLTNCNLASGAGSDFEFWQHGRIMDQACKVVSQQHSLLISSSVIAKSDGTGSLTEFSAQAIEKKVQRALDNVIGSAIRGIGPTAIDGTIGHVSDIRYQVDRTNNVLSTKTLIATVAIVPRGYLKTLTATLSFKLST
jgi:hypothetical protein